MKEVIIRSNYGKNIGLGHLYRSLKLANQLKKEEYKRKDLFKWQDIQVQD